MYIIFLNQQHFFKKNTSFYEKVRKILKAKPDTKTHLFITACFRIFVKYI